MTTTKSIAITPIELSDVFFICDASRLVFEMMNYMTIYDKAAPRRIDAG